MAIFTTISTGAAVADQGRDLFRSIFGGSNPAQESRERKRGALQQAGFIWRKTSGVPQGEEWNIDNWSTAALDNIERAYNQFGQPVVELHNSRQLNSAIAENYTRLIQVVEANLPDQSRPTHTGVSPGNPAMISAGAGGMNQVVTWGLVGLLFIGVIGFMWK